MLWVACGCWNCCGILVAELDSIPTSTVLFRKGKEWEREETYENNISSFSKFGVFVKYAICKPVCVTSECGVPCG